MMSIRLMRLGARSRPSYRIVVVDSRKPRESRAKDTLGFYNPLKEPPEISIDREKAKFWLDRGARPSETVKSLLERTAAPTKPTDLRIPKS